VVGWRDRDYSKATRSHDGARLAHRGARASLPSAVLLLTLLHVAGFTVVWVSATDPYAANMLAAVRTGGLGHWLHPLLMDDPLHFLLVIAALWLIGTRVEQAVGALHLLAVYTLGAASAAVGFLMIESLAPQWASLTLEFPAGSLAAVALSAWRHSRYSLVTVFGRTVTYRTTLSLSVAIVAALTLMGRGTGAVGWVTAVAAGALASPICDALSSWRRRRAFVRARPGVLRARTAVKAQEPAFLTPGTALSQEADIDDLLAKISKGGLNSLSPAERARLERARQRMLRSAHMSHGADASSTD
jgi:hypothetical protein